MTEEEKEAIKRLNLIKRTYDRCAPNTEVRNNACQNIEAIDTILKLIEKYREVYFYIEETMIDYDKKHIDKDKTIEEIRKYLSEIRY